MRRRTLFLIITLLAPFLFLAAIEGALRLAWAGGAMPAFDSVRRANADYLAPGQRLGRRYFAAEALPPTPPVDLFAATKPRHALRVFVLGESTTAGFPYPPNGSFPRLLRDALRDVLPNDSVEVVNLGLAATNSYTIVDLADEVIAQHPDAVLIYAGHNEYYGALGAGSSIYASSSPVLVRAYLRSLRFRTVVLLRSVMTLVMQATRRPADSTAATFMESVARDEQIELGDRTYRAGLAQFRENLSLSLSRFARAGVPVFLASIASNVRDQPPFVSANNAPARAAFDSASRVLAAGDTASARQLFFRARDLDVIRFRAPAAVDDIIRAAAATHGAHYVPVAERFAAASPGGIPGHEYFLEHVHPNQRGYALIAETFFDALRDARFLGHASRVERLQPWSRYVAGMRLTPIDSLIVQHTVRTVTTRWPFVARDAALDYRGTYRPRSLADSLALLVSRGGMNWADAKLRIASDEEARGYPDSAAQEYLGLVRDQPLVAPPLRLAARALLEAGRDAEAVPLLERAQRLAPQWESDYALGMIALRRRDFPQAITLLDRAATAAPSAVAPVYQLSLAFGLARNLEAARGAARRAARLDPHYPGLSSWMTALGLPAPGTRPFDRPRQPQ
jgi:lysophospholipase L1-like esterase/Flp pilus assembly protein TadD